MNAKKWFLGISVLIALALIILFILHNTSTKQLSKHSSTRKVTQTQSKIDPNYTQPYRDQYHYSAKKTWLNDPNGLIYSNGMYHMFYQTNPEGNTWGNMSWGHAVSSDLYHWKEQPVAIAQQEATPWADFRMQTSNDSKPVHYYGRPTTNGDAGNPNGKRFVFSGSIIKDTKNAAGLGKNTLIAFYTSAYSVAVRDDDYSKDSMGNFLGLRDVQEQCIAYSKDDGKTFIQYKRNPVIPAQAAPTRDPANFRDPKVVYDEAHKQWVMILAAGQEADIFTSSDLIHWTYRSAIIREHDVGNGAWECPELIPMTAEGTKEKKWVFSVSVQKGAPAGGSGMQYFVGSFNGKEFVPDTEQTLSHPKWLDYGEDLYAGVTFSNMKRTVMLSWMSNWDYVGEQKTSPWKGEMSLPRELTLVHADKDTVLSQRPARELSRFVQNPLKMSKLKLGGTKVIKQFSGTQYRAAADFSWDSKDRPNQVGFRFRVSQDRSKYITAGYDVQTRTVFIDRANSGGESTRSQTKVQLNEKASRIKLTAYVDSSSIELFVNDGERTLTQIIYPNPAQPLDSKGIALFSTGGTAQVRQIEVAPFESIWRE
jgi:sucrose-6-phosphate hydrolase SacC (GH32 family)